MSGSSSESESAVTLPESLTAADREAVAEIVALVANSRRDYRAARRWLDQAAPYHQSALQANPKEPNVHFGLGYLLWTKGQYAEAAAEFQAEIDNDPRHVQAMLYLADSKMQTNQPEDARTLLEKVVKLSPASAIAHRDLGIIYADQDRKQDAMTEFQAAIKLAPKDVNAHWRLGRLYRSMGKSAEAKLEFDKANSLNKAEDERLLKVMSTIPNEQRKAASETPPQK